MTRILKSDMRYIAQRAANRACAEMDDLLAELQSDLAVHFYGMWASVYISAEDMKVLPKLSQSYVTVESSWQQFRFEVTSWDDERGTQTSIVNERFNLLDGVSLRFPANHENYRLTVVLEKDSEDYRRLSNYQNLKQQREKQYVKIESQVKAFLEAHTTVKKALAVWPELRELFPERLTKPATKDYLPAFNPTDLNGAIGLPSKEKEAA